MLFKHKEQRRVVRQEGVVEGALLFKHQDDGRNKKKQNKKIQGQNSENFAKRKKASYPHIGIVKKCSPSFQMLEET